MTSRDPRRIRRSMVEIRPFCGCGPLAGGMSGLLVTRRSTDGGVRALCDRDVVPEPEVPHLLKILGGEARVHRSVETVRGQIPAAAVRQLRGEGGADATARSGDDGRSVAAALFDDPRSPMPITRGAWSSRLSRNA
jgi:hypothetical protein